MPNPSHLTVPARPAIALAPGVLQRYAGRYRTPDGHEFVISLNGDHLRAFFYRKPEIELVPRSEREFALRWTAARVLFELDGEGRPTALIFEIGGDQRRVERVD